MDPLIPIFLLHGLGARPITLWPLEQYLRVAGGFENTHCLYYPVDRMEFEQSVNYVDSEMSKICSKEHEEVVLIGQSMGGVVANSLHKRGWKVRLAVYIGSPLHGAQVLNQLEAALPTSVWDWLYKKPYDFLKFKSEEREPPHPYHTISMAWPFADFDGCVYRQEATLREEHHTHLPWADHRTVFVNPRLWHRVNTIVSQHLD